MSSGFLTTKGTKIVDAEGNPIVLKGTACGGSLNMENFITGYPGHFTEHKNVIAKKSVLKSVNFSLTSFTNTFGPKRMLTFMPMN